MGVKEQLEKQRNARIKKIEDRDGLKDGHFYKMRDGAQIRWFEVWVEFYPETRWLYQEYDDLLKRNKIKDSRGILTDEMRARLEDWL